MLKIGRLKLKSNLILAPMAGISDFPFRMLNREFGVELAFSEMINCRSVSFKNRRTRKMLFTVPDDRPLGVQLLGCEPDYIRRSLDIISAYKFDLLDFNAACPAKKVVRRGEGAGLLRSPEKLGQIVKLITRQIKLPVSVKIRCGWDKDSVNAIDAAKASQDAGAQAVFMHGRTRAQGYSGKVDYQLISGVKKAISIPLIASGDIFSPVLAEKMLERTGCDGLIIARGALGNPWIFRQISGYLKGNELTVSPSYDQTADTMLKHLNMCVDFYGEKNGVIIFRKFYGWYTKGFRKIRPLREKSNRIKTKQEMIDIINLCRKCNE